MSHAGGARRARARPRTLARRKARRGDGALREGGRGRSGQRDLRDRLWLRARQAGPPRRGRGGAARRDREGPASALRLRQPRRSAGGRSRALGSPRRHHRGPRQGDGALKDDKKGRFNLLLRVANFERAVGRTAAARARLEPLLAADATPALSRAQRKRVLDLLDAVGLDERAHALEDWPAPRPRRRGGWRRRRRASRRRSASTTRFEIWRSPSTSRPRTRRPGARSAGCSPLHGGALEPDRADEALRKALALEPAWADLRALRDEIARRRAGRSAPAPSPRVVAPSEHARALFQEAEEWIDVGDPSASAATCSIRRWLTRRASSRRRSRSTRSGPVPQATVAALTDDGAGLWALVDRRSELAGAHSRGKDAAKEADVDIAHRAPGSIAPSRSTFRRPASRARLARAAAGDRAGALDDLVAYVAREPRPAHLAEARACAPGSVRRPTRPTQRARRRRAPLPSPARPHPSARRSPRRRAPRARRALRRRAARRPRDWRSAASTSMRSVAPTRACVTSARRAGARGDDRGARSASRGSTRACPDDGWRRGGARAARRRRGRARERRRVVGSRAARRRRGRLSAALADVERRSRRRRRRPGPRGPGFPRRAPRARAGRATIAARARRRVAPPLVASPRSRRSRWSSSRSRAAAGAVDARGGARRRPAAVPRGRARIGELRHDVLKHRVGVLGLASDPQVDRADLARALLEPTPASAVVAADRTSASCRRRAGRASRCGRSAASRRLGALCRRSRARRALALVARAGRRRRARDRPPAARRARRSRSRRSCSRGRARASARGALADWIAAVEASARGDGARWIAPALLLGELDSTSRRARRARRDLRTCCATPRPPRPAKTGKPGTSSSASSASATSRAVTSRASSWATRVRRRSRSPSSRIARADAGSPSCAISCAPWRGHLVVRAEAAPFTSWSGHVSRCEVAGRARFASSSAKTAASTSIAFAASSARPFDFFAGARFRRGARRRGDGRRAALRSRLPAHAARPARRRGGATVAAPDEPARAAGSSRRKGSSSCARCAPRGVGLPAILFADLDDAAQLRLPRPHARAAHRRRQPDGHRRDRDAPPRHEMSPSHGAQLACARPNISSSASVPTSTPTFTTPSTAPRTNARSSARRARWGAGSRRPAAAARSSSRSSAPPR